MLDQIQAIEDRNKKALVSALVRFALEHDQIADNVEAADEPNPAAIALHRNTAVLLKASAAELVALLTPATKPAKSRKAKNVVPITKAKDKE